MLMAPPCSTSSTLPSHPHPSSPFQLHGFPSPPSLYAVFSALKAPTWHLSRLLVSMSILVETCTSADQREYLKKERKHSTFAFWGLGDLTQNDCFQLHPFIWKFLCACFFNSQTRFRCANVQHFHHPFID